MKIKKVFSIKGNIERIELFLDVVRIKTFDRNISGRLKKERAEKTRKRSVEINFV